MPAAWTTRGFGRMSRRIMKSANDSSGGCSLGRMPLPDNREIVRRSMHRQESPRRFCELFDRQLGRLRSRLFAAGISADGPNHTFSGLSSV